MFSNIWCNVFFFLNKFSLSGQLYGYIASSFATSSILVFFGNLYIVPKYGYTVFLILSSCLSLSNFGLLYFLNVKPDWPPSVYVTLKSRDDIHRRITEAHRALTTIDSAKDLLF